MLRCDAYSRSECGTHFRDLTVTDLISGVGNKHLHAISHQEMHKGHEEEAPVKAAGSGSTVYKVDFCTP
jgi:hypothetical protein